LRLLEQAQSLRPLRVAEIGADNVALRVGEYIGVFPATCDV
jgi:hypothetical protein